MLKKRRVVLSSKAKPLPLPSSPSDDIYIGIDLSMTDTGLVALHEDRSLIRSCSLKTTKKHGRDDTRASIIVDTILEFIHEYTDTNKVTIFIEAIPFSKRATGKLFTRYGIYATLKYMLRKEGLETYSIGATTLKNRMAGTGNADKDAIQRAIFTKYRLRITNDNVADAFACADIGIAYKKEKMRLNIERLPLEG